VAEAWHQHPLPLEVHPWSTRVVPTLPTGDEVAGRHRTARPGEVLQRERVRPDRFSLIRSGCVVLRASIRGGVRPAIGFLGPGQAFGQEAVIPTRSTVVVPEAAALTEVRLLVVPAGEAQRSFAKRPWFAAWMASAVADRLAAVESLGPALAGLPARARVLTLLRHLAATWGRPAPVGTHIGLPLTQDLIAAATHLTRETVNRSLRDLTRMGRVRRSGRSYVLTDPIDGEEGDLPVASLPGQPIPIGA
jgi:CRP-like cAMP-binding protein